VQEPLEREHVSSDAHFGQDGVTSGQARHRRKIVRRVFSTSVTRMSALCFAAILRLIIPLFENSMLKVGTVQCEGEGISEVGEGLNRM
jgi:hypothetical protein